jgi:hypothetical protein
MAPGGGDSEGKLFYGKTGLVLDGCSAMPVVPHLPSEDPESEDAPDLGDIVDRIIGGGGDPGQPVPA